MTMAFVPYPGNEGLAEDLAAARGGVVVPVEHRGFPDGETYLRVGGDVRDQAVVIACGLDRPDTKTVGLYLLASTLRELGARRVVLAAPYLGYMRQDRVFHEGEGVTARYFAQLLSGFLDGLATVDPHLHRIHDLSEVYSIPTRAVAAAPAIAAWIAANVDAPIVVGPDAESEQWASDVARRAGCPFVLSQKTRRGDRSVEVVVPDLQSWRDRTPVLIDDIISTAKTMIAAVRHVRETMPKPPVCAGVHAVFAEGAYRDLLAAKPSRIVTCNTISHETNAIDVRPALAAALADLAAETMPS
jgi:ribose-phosphate pyrophosphokinase